MATVEAGTARVLVFDPFAGISGDMMLGALLDLGLPEDWLKGLVASLKLGDVGVRFSTTTRRGIACRRVEFELPPQTEHRHLSQIQEIIAGSPVPEQAKTRSLEAFQRIAAAEATIHGTGIERVHFHEVGALDSILDVLGAMAGVEQLGCERFYTRPVAVGSGWIEIAHGRYPLPAPATARILEGVVLAGTDLAGECTTPTGAAILMTLTDGVPPPAQLTITGSGYGAGTRDPEDRPNCLRLLTAAQQASSAALFLMQTDIDDMSPEYLPAAREALFAAGALDVTVLALNMKKDRPGWRLEALVPAAALDQVVRATFASTSTIGVRHWPVDRTALPRTEEVVQWRGQQIRRKRVLLPDGTTRWKAEYEDVVRAATALGLPLQRVQRELQSGAAQMEEGSV